MIIIYFLFKNLIIIIIILQEINKQIYTMNTELPTKVIKQEVLTPISLREMFEKDDDGKYIVFDSYERFNDTLEYCIPEHQRMPQWNKDNKEKFIETIFYGYPIGTITLSEYRKEDGNIKYNIEDGQTRLSVLQQYFDNKFSCCGKKFEDLRESQKNIYLSYKIPRIVLRKCDNISDTEHECNIHEIFERLQCGKALSDSDKIWNRIDKSIVQFAIELIEKYNTEENYFNNKNFSSKKRNILSEFTGIICTVLYSEEFMDDQYLTAYRFQCKFIMTKIITDLEKKKVMKFMDIYLELITTAYSCQDDKLKSITKPTNLNFQKCNKFWGVILIDYLQNNESLDIEKWKDIINITRVSSQFTDTIWNGIAKSDIRGATKKGLNARLKRLNDFYQNKDAITSEHGIKWVNYK